MRQDGGDLIAGMAAPQGNFDGGPRVHDIVASEDKRLELRPIAGIQFPGVDNVGGLRFRLREAGLIIFHGLEVLGVVVIHCRDDERMSVVKRQRAVRLVGLDDEGTGSRGGDWPFAAFAANAPAGIVAQQMEQLGRKDRRGCLAVRAADGDAVCGIHERGQHFATVANRQLGGECRAKFRFGWRHGRRDNQFVGVRKVRWIMSDRHRYAGAFQPFRAGRGVLVATRYPMTTLLQ